MNRKFSIFAGAILFSCSVYAQTPDGDTPANEAVCDDLLFATPGLYGLCIAYCEAQDLDGFDPSDPESVSRAMPSEKILRNYRRKMTGGDPDMPCQLPPPGCPCFTYEELDTMFTTVLDSHPESLCLQADDPGRFGYELALVDYVSWASILFIEIDDSTLAPWCSTSFPYPGRTYNFDPGNADDMSRYELCLEHATTLMATRDTTHCLILD